MSERVLQVPAAVDRFTVVTPVFNMAPYVAATIESVLANLRPGDQYFVVDGNSTDGTVEVIRRYESQLTGWSSECDTGYADALAKGFARAEGQALCWVNAGDLLLHGALDAARQELAATGSDMIFGDDFYIDEEGRVISFTRGYVPDVRAAMLYGGWTPLQDACFWRRTLYERVGGIDPFIRYAADYDLFLRLAMNGAASYVAKAFSAFRRHHGQKSIAGAAHYRRERAISRRRQLERVPEPALVGALRSAWHGVAIRWRARVTQNRWGRDDLAGVPIQTLSCASYWPPPSAQ